MAAFLRFPDGEQVPAQDGLIVGRGADAGVVIHDPVASRHHARLIGRRSGFEIEDLGSSNGTLLNGSRITRHRLHDGDVITIGKTAIAFLAARGRTDGSIEALFPDDAGPPREVEQVELVRRAPAHDPETIEVRPQTRRADLGLSRRARALLILLALVAVAGLLYLLT